MPRIKKLLNIAETQKKDDKLATLAKAIDSVHDKNKDYKELESFMKSQKSTIKEIMCELNLTNFETPNGNKATVSVVDKSFMNPELTLQYLKEHGLTQFIHTREYFDEAEIAMAIANAEINAQDLAPFVVKQTEYRLNAIK